jgi:hypothetical protein
MVACNIEEDTYSIVGVSNTIPAMVWSSTLASLRVHACRVVMTIVRYSMHWSGPPYRYNNLWTFLSLVPSISSISKQWDSKSSRSVHSKPSRHIHGLVETIEGCRLSFMNCKVGSHKFAHCILMAIMGCTQLVADRTNVLGFKMISLTSQASVFQCYICK